MKKASKIFLNIHFFIVICFIVFAMTSTVFSQTIIDEWDTVKTPSPPQLKPVTVDAKTAALLLLDFNHQTCNPKTRPRCVNSIPKVEKLLKMARGNGIFVVYSITIGAKASDIAQELAPQPQDPVVMSGPDKFLNTDLDKILKEKGIKTVIVTGTAAHGAVLYTASGAALRGFQVIVPVDGLSAETLYPEQYTSWHLVNAPRVSNLTTLTRMDMIQLIK